jgi:hypothetical protein
MTEVNIKKKPKKPTIKETGKQSNLQTIKKGIKQILSSTPPGMAIKIGIDAGGKLAEFLTQDDKKGGETTRSINPRISEADRKLLKKALPNVKGGGLMEATAKLKAKGFSEGGAVKKDKTVAMDKSPNSGLITQRGFGASRRT